MPVWIQWVTFGFACISLGLSIWRIKMQRDTTKIAKAKENERLEEKKKADLKIYFEKETWAVIIRNEGKSKASNLKILFGVNETFKEYKTMPVIPSVFESGDELKISVMLDEPSDFPMKAKITWDDNFELNRTITRQFPTIK